MSNPNCGCLDTYRGAGDTSGAPDCGILISKQPQGAVIKRGSMLLLVPSVSSARPMQYQWYKDGELIPGATEMIYMVDEAEFAAAGVYTLKIDNNCCILDSDPATIVIQAGIGVNAGPDQFIVYPKNDTTLAGIVTGAPEFTVWSQISGPDVIGFYDPAVLNTTVTGLNSIGVYKIKLTAKDADDNTESDTMNITVSAPGLSVVVNPATITLNLPSNAASALAIGSGVGITYHWTKLSGPSQGTIQSPDTAAVNFINLVEGVYKFQVTAMDALSNTAAAVVTVTVIQPAILAVNAGTDKTIKLPVTSVQLAGTVTTPNPSSFLWSQVSGPNTASIANAALSLTPNITGLIAGSYVFKLKATDSLTQMSAEDTVGVLVQVADMTVSAGSYPPVSLPTNQIALNGTATGTNVTVQWTQLSGPNTATITAGQTLQPTMGGLIAGTYVFRITGTDQFGQVKTSNTTIQVSNTMFTAEWGWSPNPIDINSFTYQGSKQFAHDATIEADFRSAPPFQYLVLRYPDTERRRLSWFNTPFNYGLEIPDQVWLEEQRIGGYIYLITRDTMTFDTSALTSFPPDLT